MTAAKRKKNSREVLATSLMGLIAVALFVSTGVVAEFTTVQWLQFGIGTPLVLWVGGAVSGQILLARLLDRGTAEQVTDYTRQLLWIIPLFYVPMSLIALGCGIALVIVTGSSFTSPLVIIPLALYAITTIAGTAISAPGYTRLLRYADQHGAGAPEVRRKLMPLAWTNRIELTLVTGLGFTLLTAALH